MTLAQKQSWDPIWEDVFNAQEWGKYPAESLIRFIARNFYKLDRSIIKILEVGSGTGANIWYLSREGFDVYGIDGSKTAFNIANDRLKSEGLKATLQVGDIVNLPYTDNFFDAVIDVECIYSNSISNAKIIFKEIARVLKKEGKFYSRTFSDRMFTGMKGKEIIEKGLSEVSQGTLAGKGFVRLASLQSIEAQYKDEFNVDSVDLHEYTVNNNDALISEYVIIAKKK